MKVIYITMGCTGIKVSAVALGIERFIFKSITQARNMLHFAAENGINFIDICLTDPKFLTRLFSGLNQCPHKFVIQGHVGSIWKNGQYQRSRDMQEVRRTLQVF